MWTSWKKICDSRELGGLGMIELRRFNVALLGKWIWRLGTDKKGLWKEVLESKYGGWRNLKTQRNNILDSLWWRDQKEVWNFEGWKGKFEANFIGKVGNRMEISLWEDKWVGNEVLKDKFLRFFSICFYKESKLWQ